MSGWWRRRPLKLRLALWFTLVASAVLLAMVPVVYGLIEFRLHAELDAQLRADWAQARAGLSFDSDGIPQWHGPADAELPEAAGPWFDLWSGDGRWLYGQPSRASQASADPPRADGSGPRFGTLDLDGRDLRTLAAAVRIGTHDVILRVLRDEEAMHHTLREILIALLLALPLIAALAAAAGYVTAGRMLRPVGVMAERARLISSRSLDQRLPVPNRDDELGRLAAAFNATLQRLQVSFDSLRHFTSDASHELRTPLTALRAVGEVALRNPAGEPALREAIGSMLEEAGRLDDLVESLLALARAEGNDYPLRPQAIPLCELLTELRDTVAVLTTEKQQTVEVAGDAAVTATGDRLLVRQAIMNVLFNAIRYSPVGATIGLRCWREGAEAVVEITDNGPGIAPGHLQQVFERFFRVDTARAREAGGVGLGLAIAKSSVERNGGRIEVQSELGRVSRFRIVLPA
ncbi:MAG TPA: ATP-binding protein [Steroidobacteraceae bacterium]|nr:ATP-binding protein [Steroidobacteraceae bacterium]